MFVDPVARFSTIYIIPKSHMTDFFLLFSYIFPYIGVRDSLTGYVVPERIGDRAWMAWENSSVAVAAAAAVAHGLLL